MANGLPQNTDRCGIISACTWALDRIKIIDHWPQEEHLTQIRDTDQQGGGCGYNLAIDIRKLDDSIPVEAIGMIGNDADGRFLLDHAASAGVDIKQLRQTDAAQTSFTDVFSVAGTGRRTFFHHTGSSDHITPDHFDFTECKGRILHLGLLGVHEQMDNTWNTDANGWVTVLKKAQDHGIHTNLELVSIAEARIREIALPCVPHINSLITNEYELGALAGSGICDEHNQIDGTLFIVAAEKLFSESAEHNGVLQLIIAHCPSIAFALHRDGTLFSRKSFTVDPQQVVSTVGAGDAFAAGISCCIDSASNLILIGFVTTGPYNTASAVSGGA